MMQAPSLSPLIERSHEAISFAGIDFDDADTLAKRLITTATSSELKIVTAESCTAGLIAHKLSRPPGAAAVLAGGFVTYTKDAKTRMLGVPSQLFGRQGAVHAAVAEAMARGARELSGADYAIAITGVTGTEPDEDGNPIGRAFLGLASADLVASLHCELGRREPQALTDLAIRAALLFTLAGLGDERARTTLRRLPSDPTI